MSISKENFPKLRLSNSMTRSQASNAFSSRHKVQSSHESFEVTDSLLTPNRIRSKDQLTLIDEALDAKEISIRNNPTKDCYFDYFLYQEHLEVIASTLKKSNPRLGFSISRGIAGCFKAFSAAQSSQPQERLPKPISLNDKKPLRDNVCQTEDPKFEDNDIKLEDIELLRGISGKLGEINIKKVAMKLRDLDRSLRRIRTEIPDLSQIPELDKFNVHETIDEIEKHVKKMQSDVALEVMKRKLQSIPLDKKVQTEFSLIDPHSHYALEDLLVDKEQELFELKKKCEVLKMEKDRISESLDEFRHLFDEAQKNSMKLRKKNVKTEIELKETKAQLEMSLTKSEKKRRKIKELRRVNEEQERKNARQRAREKDLVKMWKNAVIDSRVNENKLNEITEAYRIKVGKPFQFSVVDVEKIAAAIKVPDSDQDMTEAEFEAIRNIDLKTTNKIAKALELFSAAESMKNDPEITDPKTKSLRGTKHIPTQPAISKSGAIKAAELTRKLTQSGQDEVNALHRSKKKAEDSEENASLNKKLKKSNTTKRHLPGANEGLSDSKQSDSFKNHKIPSDDSEAFEAASGSNPSNSKRHREMLEGDSEDSIRSSNGESESPSKRNLNRRLKSDYLSKFRIPQTEEFPADPQDIAGNISKRPGKFKSNGKSLANDPSSNESRESMMNLGQSRSKLKSLTQGLNHTGSALTDLATNDSNLSLSKQELDDFTADGSGENDILLKLQQKCYDLLQGTQTDDLIKEDPEEYARHTYSLFNTKDALHSKILSEFPNINVMPKKYQIEIFRIMAEHEKTRCVGKCKHLTRVQMLKYKIKGVPYPIRKMTMNLERK